MARFSNKRDRKEYTVFQLKESSVVKEIPVPTPVRSLKLDPALVGKVIVFSVHKAITCRFVSLAVAIVACVYFAYYLISTHTSYLVI